MFESFLNGRVVLHSGDCLDVLARLEECSLDSCVTDPPYHLTSIVQRFGAGNAAPAQFGSDGRYARASAGFMGKQWDGGAIAFDPATWRAVYRVLKPGAHLIACGGTRTYHRMACAIEDAGFEIRDTISWLYGSGFPKSHDVSKGIDRAAGAVREIIKQGRSGSTRESYNGTNAGRSKDFLSGIRYETMPSTDAARQWEGWGTALKPACELIVLARKPLSEGTVAANVLRWGTGAINVDGCRIGTTKDVPASASKTPNNIYGAGMTSLTGGTNGSGFNPNIGRWPANVAHDGSEEVTAAFPETTSGALNAGHKRGDGDGPSGKWMGPGGGGGIIERDYGNDTGSAARFFFQAKQDDPCHSIRSASDAVESFALQSEHVVSVLSRAVALTTERLALEPASYRAPDMNVSAQQFALIVASVTEAIQNIERRCLLGLPLENITVRLGLATCVAIQNQIGTTTITASLSMFDPSAEAVTFNIIETSAEVGAQVYGKRLYYTAKADADDRLGSKHPTVKPLDLMQWLVRLVTPRNGVVLDPFAGTGTTGEAAWREGMRAVLIEAEPEYQADIRRRMALVMAGPDERSRESIKAKNLPVDYGPLFGFPEAAE